MRIGGLNLIHYTLPKPKSSDFDPATPKESAAPDPLSLSRAQLICSNELCPSGGARASLAEGPLAEEPATPPEILSSDSVKASLPSYEIITASPVIALISVSDISKPSGPLGPLAQMPRPRSFEPERASLASSARGAPFGASA